MANMVQWRAFIGPKWHKATDAQFWNWATALTYGAAYTPTTAIPATTLNGAIDLGSDSTIVLSDASSYPTAGGFWVGPVDSGEAWGYVEYSGKSSNTVTVEDYDTIDSEYPGTHGDGATVRFWWPLTPVIGDLEISETMDRNLSVVNWSAELQGVNIPQAALRNEHLILVQIRQLSGSDWGNWTNELVGWLDAPQVQDDKRQRRDWSARVRSSLSMLDADDVSGVRAGVGELLNRLSTSSSTSLAKPYKVLDLAEFTEAEPNLDAQQALDTDIETLWMGERYIGKANNPANPGTSYDGIDAGGTGVVSQIHITRYPGQSTGSRWIEITFLTSPANWNDLLCYSVVGVNDYITDYFLNFDATALDKAWTSGDRLIIAENAALFEAENPDHDATEVVDASSLSYYINYAHQWELSIAGGTPTTGSFILRDTDYGVNPDSNSIAWNATAAQVQAAINGYINTYTVHCYGGPLPSTPVSIVLQVKSSTYYNSAPNFQVKPGSSTLDAGTPTLTQTHAAANGVLLGAAGAADDWFGVIGADQGGITQMNSSYQAYSTVRWGTMAVPPGAGDGNLWIDNGGATSATIDAMTAGETARYIYAPTSPTEAADYWEVSQVATPGYNANGTSYLMFRRPGMGLRLGVAINSSQTGAVSVVDLSGDSVPDGIATSGTTTIQIGLEQLTVTRSADVITISSRGANGTTAAAHSKGDVIYVVESGVAVDAMPLKKIYMDRLNATLPAAANFVVRGSLYSQVRNPTQTNYTDDWTTITTVTGNTDDTWDYTLGAAARYQWLLFELTAMETTPYRPVINRIRTDVDTGVFASSRLLSSPDAADVISQIFQNAGVPSGAITDSGGTTTVGPFTTAKDRGSAIVADLADMCRVRVTVNRASAIDLADDLLWYPSLIFPSSESTLTQAELIDWAFEWRVDRGIGQVELLWRNTSGDDQTPEYYPATLTTGRKLTIGPYIYANSSAAQAGAHKRYFTRRIPFEMSGEMADIGRSYRAGQVHLFVWPLDSTMNSMSRKGLLTAVNHRIGDGRWQTILHAVQLGREDFQ